MPYKSSLSDEEWKIVEPLLVEILPPKKRTRPANWSKREILDGITDQRLNGCNWQDLPLDLPPYKGGLLALAFIGRQQEQSKN